MITISKNHPLLTGNRLSAVRERKNVADAIVPGMTLMTVTYELQNPLEPEQFRILGQFANTYGLQRVRFDEKTNHLHFDYDGSRLTRGGS
jgi:hypothetical protein